MCVNCVVSRGRAVEVRWERWVRWWDSERDCVSSARRAVRALRSVVVAGTDVLEACDSSCRRSLWPNRASSMTLKESWRGQRSLLAGRTESADMVSYSLKLWR